MIWIRAFTHRFVAGPEFGADPSVFRVSETPATDTVVCADTVVTPVSAEVSVIVQEPVPPPVVHGFGVVKLPGPESIVKLICVPSGAFTKPVPSFTFTCAVNVCGVTDPVHTVRRDRDVRVHHLQRLTRHHPSPYTSRHPR